MTAQKIDGTAIAKGVRESIKDEIQAFQQTNPEFKPSLTIIQVGERPDSNVYVRMKLKAAAESSIEAAHLKFPETVSEADLLAAILAANANPLVHGILVQLPLPAHISEHAVTSAVAADKDVDGFGVASIGELAKRGGKPLFAPCTPLGCMALLRATGVEVAGKHAVVLGRSDTVGSPVSYMLRNADATVTMCHSRTRGMETIVGMADILVAAIGKPKFVKGEWLKPGVVVIDVGINSVPDATRKSGQRLVGDVDYDAAVEVASHITPVPGGVGANDGCDVAAERPDGG